MRILVFVKQIPEIGRIEFDPGTNRIVRDKVPLIINPFDKRAVEEGIRIKEKQGGNVTVVSMGPESAIEILDRSLRMGADRAILISDPIFAGSDTLVTSEILGGVVKKLHPDLVLMGKYSLDGETSQVPPETAIFSGYEFKSSISRIELDGSDTLLLEQEREDRLVRYEAKLPIVISVSEKINKARSVNPEAPDRSGDIERWSAVDVEVQVRGADSPTVVESTERLENHRHTQMLDTTDDLIKVIASEMSQKTHSENNPVTPIPDPTFEDLAVAVSVGSRRSGYEITSKTSELGLKNRFRSVVIGEFPPGDMLGLPCNEYIFLQSASVKAFSEFLIGYIEKNSPKFVVFPSNVIGREIAAHVAAKLRLGLTADCVDISFENGSLIQYKPAFGGGIIAKIISKTKPQLATVRPGIFRPRHSNDEFKTETVDLSTQNPENPISTEIVPSEYAPLPGSRVVIGVGRGIVKKENIPLILELASSLGAAIGGTRPIVDLGWLPRQQQVGLTGCSISPDLYISIGVSGSDNHVVGIRHAKTVVAVNNDPAAYIFNFADYGLVADSMEFVQELLKKIPEIRPQI